MKKQNDDSALSEHAVLEHMSVRMSIADFDVEIIDKYNGPVECKIGEAKLIERMKPTLNRKDELKYW